MKRIVVGYWSAGITSAVACKVGLSLYDNVRLIYIETGKAHPDNNRFKEQCENWYGVEIETRQNTKGYKNPIDVARRERYINGPDGAKCTKVLKKDVRFSIEEEYEPSLFNNDELVGQIFGYEFEKKQVNRAIRLIQQYPESKPLFPLIEKGITKNQCAGLLLNAGIELPKMYQLGFSNNNCIGCFKGGKGYWNLIRKHFPEEFNQTAIVERELNHSCIKGVFLDQLEPGTGHDPAEVMPECGVLCEVDFADLIDVSLDKVMRGEVSVYEAALKATTVD